MNDDGWYTSFVSRAKASSTQKNAPTRRGTANEGVRADILPVEALSQTVDASSRTYGPPPATLARRAKSYSDFYNVVRAHIRKENRAERDKLRKQSRSRETKIRNQVEFGRWYASIQADLLDASCDEYAAYHSTLHLAEQHLDSLLSSASTALQLLSTLSQNFKAVEQQTTAFQAQCEHLLDDQTRMTNVADDVAENLQYYTYLEPMTRRLNAPGAGRLVGGKDFSDMLSNLDACLEYMQAHPKHREAETYRAKYRLLLTRSLTLTRNHFANAVKEVTADIEKRIKERQLNDTTQSALLYAKFRVPAPEMKAIGMEIQKRAVLPKGAEPGSEAEYQGLMNELYQTYSMARSRLLRPIIAKNASELAASSKDLVSFAQSGMGFLKGICEDEYDLWHEWFDDDEAFYDFLEELIEPFYDHLRPRTIHEQAIQKLCELCMLIQSRYMAEDSDDDEVVQEERKLDFAHIIAPALEDAQSRLAFLTVRMVRDEIEYYRSKPQDLAYPKKLQQLAGSREGKGPVLSGRKGSNGTLAKVMADGEEGDLGYKSGLEDAYPTLRKAVWLLSRIYRLVHSSIFDDLAHQIVHQTTLSLHAASLSLSKSASPTDAQLFLISHLLLLKQQIVAFDIEFVSPEITIDYGGTFWELRERGGLFNPVNWVGMLVPRVVRDMLDAKGEVDGRLREVINAFVSGFSERMGKPLEKTKKKGDKVMSSQEAQLATSEVRKTIEKDVPFLRRKLGEYITDARTRETLVAAIMDQAVEGYEDWYEAWSEGVGSQKGGKKGKGREDEVWGPAVFSEWASGVFQVSHLGFLEGEEDGGRSRRTSLGSL